MAHLHVFLQWFCVTVTPRPSLIFKGARLIPQGSVEKNLNKGLRTATAKLKQRQIAAAAHLWGLQSSPRQKQLTHPIIPVLNNTTAELSSASLIPILYKIALTALKQGVEHESTVPGPAISTFSMHSFAGIFFVIFSAISLGLTFCSLVLSRI